MVGSTETSGFGLALTQRNIQRLWKQGGLPDEFDHLTFEVNSSGGEVHGGAVLISRSVVSAVISAESGPDGRVVRNLYGLEEGFLLNSVEEVELGRVAELLGLELRVGPLFLVASFPAKLPPLRGR